MDAFLELGVKKWLGSDDLSESIRRAADVVSGLAGDGRAPGSTLTGVGLSEQAGLPCWLIFNIGDSRTHLLREGELNQISIDHSAVVRAAAQGAGDLPPRNVITRALGAGISQPVADQWLIPAQVGDRVLICSDGLTNEVTQELLTATLLAHPEPQAAANELVQAALQAGGHDNVTAIVVDCEALVSSASGVATVASTTISDDTVPDGSIG